MGVDTKAIIRNGLTILDITEHLNKKYKEVKVHNTHADYYFVISFKDGKDNRQLNLFFGDLAFNDYGIAGTLLSLGYWGNSIEIMEYFLNEYGGYLDKNDCDDEEFMPVNLEKYEQGSVFSELDLFKNKIVSKIGFDKLNVTLQLFEEYKSIKL